MSLGPQTKPHSTGEKLFSTERVAKPRHLRRIFSWPQLLAEKSEEASKGCSARGLEDPRITPRIRSVLIFFVKTQKIWFFSWKAFPIGTIGPAKNQKYLYPRKGLIWDFLLTKELRTQYIPGMKSITWKKSKDTSEDIVGN